jgi:hypothetical protein
MKEFEAVMERLGKCI